MGKTIKKYIYMIPSIDESTNRWSMVLLSKILRRKTLEPFAVSRFYAK